MKAVVYTEFGPPNVLELKQVEKPTPADKEILVKVYATPVGYGDIITRNFRNSYPHQFNMPFLFWLLALTEFGFRRPKRQILGAEFAGEVEAIGKGVTRFKEGDPVFGYLGSRFGANAEYLCMPEDGLVALKPVNMTYEEAATVPYGALTALNLLRKVDIQPGDKILINGASGAIGSAAVQLARHFGAQVTGVCGAPGFDFVKALGADAVIDYTTEDFTQNDETYDVIFDVLGRSSFSRCKRVLKPNGRYLLASFKMKQLLQMLWTSIIGDKKVICTLSMEKPEDLLFVKELMEAGKIQSIIDRRFPLDQAAEAHRYVEAGHKRGSVILIVPSTGQDSTP